MTAVTRQLLNEAARWFMRMRDVDPGHPDRSRFEAWLLSDPAHAREYAAFAETWEDFDTTPKLQSLAQAMERRKQHLAAQRDGVAKRVRRGLLGIMLLATGGLLGHITWRDWQAQPLMELASSTGIRQIGRQTLDDGTKLVLNADTQLRIVYYRDKRHVVMEKGEAIFEVARDPSRPFIVDSGQARVTVLGTRFAVNRLDHLVRVSVDHGRVKVESQGQQNDSTGGHVILTDGQVAEVRLDGLPQLVQRRAHDAFSFPSGTVVFHQASLGEIAQTLSRYRDTPFRVQHGTASDAKVTAVVQSWDIENFLKLLPRIAPVHVENTLIDTRLVPVS